MMTAGFFDGNAAHSLLMQYSEWLDVENIQIRIGDDGRAHADLVDTFIAQRDIHAYPMLERTAVGLLDEYCGQ
jgi:hypothetical protein